MRNKMKHVIPALILIWISTLLPCYIMIDESNDKGKRLFYPEVSKIKEHFKGESDRGQNISFMIGGPNKSQPVPKEQVTMVMMTYRKGLEEMLNNPLLQNILPLSIVKELILIWNDALEPDTSQLSRIHSKFDYLGMSHKLQVLVSDKKSLSSRFLVPLPKIKTSAVYTTDDDWTTSIENFELGFQLWQQNRHRLVGFLARRLENGKYISFSDFNYIPKIEKDAYNILLPGGGLFFNVEVLQMYREMTPNKILARQHVDKVFNCEDIFFNFIVPKSYHPPLLVAINRTETQYYIHRTDGVSNGAGYWQKRQTCVKVFTKLLGWPFINTNEIAIKPLN